jgi:hypothetical protein
MELIMIVDDMYKIHCEQPSDIYQLLPILHMHALKCNHITEFGVRSIVSTWAFLSARPQTLVSYDLAHPNNSGGNLQQAIDAAAEAGVNFQFHQDDVLKITIEPTDMLFIDTYHQYGQLKQELKLHAHKVRKYIAFHDTYLFGWEGEGNSQPGLLAAIDEFLLENPIWSVIEETDMCNGLMVLQRNA